MAVRVRRLGPGDAATLAAVTADAAAFDLEHAGGGDEPLDEAAARAFLAGPGVRYWVAEADGVVLGAMHCHRLAVTSGAGCELLLYAIGVREEARGRGVGKALVAAAEALMRDEGIRDVWVLADNPGAAAFYEALGFAADQEEDGFPPRYLVRTLS